MKLKHSGHLMQRANPLEKTPFWERPKAKGEGVAENEMVREHHRLMSMNVSKPQDTVEDRGASSAAVHWVPKSQT